MASSSRLRASGNATSKAEVVTTHTTFPAIFPLFLKKEAVFEILDEMEWRVAGGITSARAATRSKKDSWTETSEAMEDRDSVELVREEEAEPYGELAASFSSTISTLTMTV